VGILGSSGTGKTTLLNVLSGVEKPSSGGVRLNGYDISSEEIQGSIGYIPQDDLLIEELTVYENLYFNARLCFKNLGKEEIHEKVEQTLERLGLLSRKDLKVGSAFNKTISGGQRKRLNIALELIREPSVLFVDEPTSGLSSRDSENVMDLLRELTLMGKLIFVVIHQPSSEIFKMFDNTIIMDEGGYMVYYGNPVEAVMYFKLLDNQINSQVGECPVCGNVNPELIFNILEARVVDEYGNYTRRRKISPEQWNEFFRADPKNEEATGELDKPPKSLEVPNWFRQLKVFTKRDVISKFGNRQYILLTLLEAPVLGFILSYIIRYIADPASDTYLFRENENIPIYIFMAMIVAIFLGLTVSAEEIFRDRKILKRERFLQLSRSGYLVSKIVILFTISAIQAFLFVGVANTIIEIRFMYFEYWFAFFTTAAFANLLGLNISSAFNSAVTIYIVIPLLIIPMMVLSGAMFSFEKLNRNISRIDKVPLLAEIMPTRWSYEALMVNQFKNNFFQQNFYELDKNITNADFKISYYLPELESRLLNVQAELQVNDSIENTVDDLLVLKNEFLDEKLQVELIDIPSEEFYEPSTMSIQKLNRMESILDELKLYYMEVFSRESKLKNNKVKNLIKNKKDTYYSYLNDFHNERLADEVRKIYERKKIVEFEKRLVRMTDPVYQDPVAAHPLNFRTHFFSPRKHFLGNYYETYSFNMMMIWILIVFLYITLYFDILKKIVNFRWKS
jgi:ABC-type multidrug transport system ATPase subunit